MNFIISLGHSIDLSPGKAHGSSLANIADNIIQHHPNFDIYGEVFDIRVTPNPLFIVGWNIAGKLLTAVLRILVLAKRVSCYESFGDLIPYFF